MTGKKRSYKQFCSVARAMDVLGERWTLLIVRDLLLGSWRYSDFLSRLPGITTNLLAERLKDMEANGIIQKLQQASVGSPHVYELTELGWKLEPVILSLASFGQSLLVSGPKKGEQLDIGRALLSLKLRCRNPGVGLLTLRVDPVAMNDSPLYYQVKYSAGYADIHHGKAWHSDVEIALNTATMAGLLFRQGDAGRLEKRGEIAVAGSRPQWLAFLKNFGLEYTAPK